MAVGAGHVRHQPAPVLANYLQMLTPRPDSWAGGGWAAPWSPPPSEQPCGGDPGLLSPATANNATNWRAAWGQNLPVPSTPRTFLFPPRHLLCLNIRSSALPCRTRIPCSLG